MRKISINHKTQALIESWVFAGLGVDLFYFISKAFDALDHKPAVINWTIVGFLFLSGAGAPALRALVAKYPKLSPFANKLIAVVDSRAGVPVTTITTIITPVADGAPATLAPSVETTSTTATAPVAESTPPLVP